VRTRPGEKKKVLFPGDGTHSDEAFRHFSEVIRNASELRYDKWEWFPRVNVMYQNIHIPPFKCFDHIVM